MDEVFKRISGFYCKKKSDKDEPFFESKYCMFQLKLHDHKESDLDQRDGKGKILQEIKYDMSRHLNVFESKSSPVKIVNGIEIKKNIPLEEQDPNGLLTLTFNDVESYGTVKVELRVSVEELDADLSKSVRDLNRDSCIFP